MVKDNWPTLLNQQILVTNASIDNNNNVIPHVEMLVNDIQCRKNLVQEQCTTLRGECAYGLGFFNHKSFGQTSHCIWWIILFSFC